MSDPDADGMCHIEVLYYDSGQLGITREEAEAFEPTPIFMACMHALDKPEPNADVAGRLRRGGRPGKHPGGGQAGLSRKGRVRGPVGGQRQPGGEALRHPGRLLDERRSPSGKGSAPRRRVLDILKKYATTREIQEETFWAIKTARSFRAITTREQIRLARAAIGLPADELVVT